MKTKLAVLLASLLLGISVAAQAAAPHEHHAHGNPEPQKLQLNAGQKWATDAPLRQAMSEINQAMATALLRIHKNQFSEADYQALAGTVSQKVAYAVANCKLEAKADAMLHLVIADLLAGAEAMESKQPEARHDGAVSVLHALQAYGKYFQHPGWKTAKG